MENKESASINHDIVEAKFTLGKVSVDPFSSIELCSKYILSLPRKNSVCAVAMNAEKVVTCEADMELLRFCRSANVLYADGIGVVIALRYRFGIKNTRIPGCELWLDLIGRLSSKDSIYLLGSTQDTLEKVKVKLKENYNIKIAGAVSGYGFDENKVIEDIRLKTPTIVFVALGTPRQELFISKCIESKIPSIFLGLGGSFDVYSGATKRAPDFFSNNGMEWLYRLICKPSRILRQIKYLGFVAGILTGRI